MSPPVHATTVARRSREGWRAVLLTGRPGAGKSETALRLIRQGWRLVSDDYTDLIASDGQLHVTAPERIAGRIEARGVGIVGAAGPIVARAVLAVALTHEAVERLPLAATATFGGVELPLIRLDGHRDTAAEKIIAAMDSL